MNEELCGHCKRSGCKSRCSKCKDVYYCNRECQVIDWKAKHKHECCKISDELRKRFEFRKPKTNQLLSTKKALGCMLTIVHSYYDINKNGLINMKGFLEMLNEINHFESSMYNNKEKVLINEGDYNNKLQWLNVCKKLKATSIDPQQLQTEESINNLISTNQIGLTKDQLWEYLLTSSRSGRRVSVRICYVLCVVLPCGLVQCSLYFLFLLLCN